jgi:hypothetical protein
MRRLRCATVTAAAAAAAAGIQGSLADGITWCMMKQAFFGACLKYSSIIPFGHDPLFDKRLDGRFPWTASIKVMWAKLSRFDLAHRRKILIH